MTWIDTPWPQDPGKLKAGGYDIMRYLCSPWNTGPGTSLPHKRLERPELDGYISAGVDAAVNFEDAADDYLGGYARGKEKGQRAGAWMRDQLAWPAGGVCCSSLDADIGPAWGGLAQEYQQGFSDGLTSAGPYLPGIYGSSIALNGANQDGTAHVFWLTAAKSWSHGIQPLVLHMWQDGYWPFGFDADLNVTVLEPMGSYLKPLGVDMQLNQADLDAVRAIVRGEVITADIVGLNHIHDLIINGNNKTQAAIAALQPVDQAALQRVVVDAIAVALASGVPAATIEQAVTDALGKATIPVVLTGHAGTAPAAG